MSAFLTDLDTRMSRPENAVKGRNRYTLLAPLVYHSEILGRIEVPAGFVTDFASIPRLLWRYIDPEDACIAYPAVVHDWLYFSQPCPREVADKVLAEAMDVSGARWDQRVAAYRAVRMFGGSHWKEI